MKPIQAIISGGKPQTKISLRRDPCDENFPEEVLEELSYGDKVDVLSLTPYYGLQNEPYLRCRTESLLEGYIIKSALRMKG